MRINVRNEKKREEQLRDDDKVPMDPILNQSPNEAWNKLYHVPLAPSQELTSQIPNRMYRGFKTGMARLNQSRASNPGRTS